MIEMQSQRRAIFTVIDATPSALNLCRNGSDCNNEE
jgi:hypothetical protein